MTDSLQECEEIIAKYKAESEQLADMVKQLQEENKALQGQLQLLIMDRGYEA